VLNLSGAALDGNGAGGLLFVDPLVRGAEAQLGE